MINSDIKSEHFDKGGRFILPDYDQKPPFSSFLPGIAGLEGIPMWVFYTNRGQAISSFGVESKDRPILEFQTANKAYQLTDLLGFRTFIKIGNEIIEPFNSLGHPGLKREMFIGMNELEIREIDSERGLEIRVLYFNLSDQPWAGLIRQISLQNLSQKEVQLEILDGLPAILPYGLDNDQLKNIGRTIESWMVVHNVQSGLPVFQLRASAEDTSSVRSIQAGNFALAVANGKPLPVVIDSRLIFGADSGFRYPRGLLTGGLGDILNQDQIQEGRTPCAFFGTEMVLAPKECQKITSIYGTAPDIDQLTECHSQLQRQDFVEEQYQQAQDLAKDLTDPIGISTANPLFDAYCRQTFLDNLLRGGWPQVLGEKHIYHTYSRKHGDPERDYNHFFLSSEKYSQGNGSYRDINQNRRSDVLFEPRTEDFNLRLFMSLIQTDGYNPLQVEGTRFSLPEGCHAEILKLVKDPKKLAPLLGDFFTPGQLLGAAGESGLKVTPQSFIDQVIGQADQHILAEFEEGYWVDHWTYNLDLIDSYLALYPDRKTEILFDSEPYPFFDSPAFVNPRSSKYVLDGDQPRQFNAIVIPEDKLALIAGRETAPNWVREEYGQGKVFRVNLFSKLVLLGILKFATRDPLGMGVEMEAGKPGWYDALNGLPGIFGSSLPESYELIRLLDFLIETLEDSDRSVTLPIEAAELFGEIRTQLKKEQASFKLWDVTSAGRERYRDRTRLGVNGETQEYPAAVMLQGLGEMRAAVQEGLEQAGQFTAGIALTYFSFQPVEYEHTGGTDPEDRPHIKPSRFEVNPLPLFLEGPVHQMKLLSDPNTTHKLYQQVRKSNLFDPVLKSYKLNTSLQDQPHSIGRARAFSRGWLENESVWPHMTLKYLLEVLKSGHYEEFFQDIQHCLPPFLDPDIYGRSPLENTSFIVSSVHPDETRHGRGFVARLTGATAEFISIWFVIMTGGKPFFLDPQGTLGFALEPKLPGWLFPESGVISYQLLGKIEVRIHNPSRADTWDAAPTRYLLKSEKDEISIDGSTLSEKHARLIRNGQISKIDLYY
jgi:hypothetical protein